MIRNRPLAMAALAGTVSVSFGALLYAFSVLVTREAAGSEFSTSILSLAYGGTVLIGGGLAFYIGRVVDARGVRGVMGTGAVLGAAGLLALSASTQSWHVVAAAWLLIGPAGAMTFYEPAFVALDQWYRPHERGRAIGTLTVVGGLAGPIFLPLTGALVEGVGWRPAAMVLAVIVGVVGAGAALFVIPGGVLGDERDAAAPHVSVRDLLRDRRFVWYTGSILLTFGAFQTVIFHRIAVFEDTGLAVGLVAFWAGVSGWISFPGRYLGPVLATRRSGIRWNAGVAAVLAVTIALLATPAGRAVMVVHFLTFGFVFGALLPMRAAVMARWFSGPRFGRIMGVQWTLAAAAGAAGPALAGVARQATGTYRPSMLATAAAMAVAAGLILVAGRSESRLPAASGAGGTGPSVDSGP